MHVVVRAYSTFYDIRTRTQFEKTLDRLTGCYVAVADVSDADAEKFRERTGFEILTDEQFFAMITKPKPTEPKESATGDPLTDPAPPPAEKKSRTADKAAQAADPAADPVGDAPPAPPSS